MTDDDNKVVKLRQPALTSAAGVVVDDPINPKSIINMTDVEQELFLQQLRERRMKAVAMLKQANEARKHAVGVMTMIKLEKKAEQVQRQLDKADKALEKLEELLYALRALTLQHTDIDITKPGSQTNDKG
jgi:uncharacterized membrane protein